MPCAEHARHRTDHRMTTLVIGLEAQLALVLAALWLNGVFTSYTMGGVIHLLLVIAGVVLIVRVIQGRRIA